MSRRPHSPEMLPNSMRRRDPPPHSNYYRPSDTMGRDPSPPRQGGGGRGRPPPDWQPPRKEFSDPPRDARDLPPPRSYPEANLPPRPPSSSRDEPPRSWDYEMRPPESFPPRPQAKRSTGSLLDRISHDVLPVDEPPSSASTSLKDRVQLPSKRDRDESLAREKGRNGHGHVNGPESYERPMEYDDVQENEGAAKRRRKNGKARRGRRGGGGGVQS
ncbi:hypothetical protein ONZ45_g5657 [Pleurotus djamor]|nr:hypothetical protein ONZ45_g5657 [Pleurotus djamor]